MNIDETDLLVAGVQIGGSFIPGVGELQDLAVLFGEGYAWWERGLSAASLAGNVITGGLLPNAGGFIRGGRAVIGKLDDIAAAKLRPGENNLLKHLEGDLGSPKANWARNSSVLRTEMKKGLPIRDASVDRLTGELLNNTGFLRAERNLLQSHGWTYDPATTMWSPPPTPR
jgi:hypothetical protein